MDQQRMLREVIEKPSKLAQLNLQSYVDELEQNNAGVMGK